MKPLSLLALSLLLSLPAAAQEDPFKRGVSIPDIQKVFNIVLPPTANVGESALYADEFYNDSLFGGAAQCVAAATPLTKAEENWREPYVEYESHAWVLAKKGDNDYQVYRFWVAGSARYQTTKSGEHKIAGLGKKGAKNAAQAKLKTFQDKLEKAIEAAKCKK